MAGVIYRKDDGQIVFPVGPGQFFRGLDVEVQRNVQPNFGGYPGDFAWLELPDDDFWRMTGLTDVRVRDGRIDGKFAAPPDPVAPTDPLANLTERLNAQQQILDLLLLGGLDDDGGTIDDEIGTDLPDSGGTLDDLEGLDLGSLPDSGETLDDLDLTLEG